MKSVKELYERLSTAKNFKEKYPDFDREDNKIHVLFLSPCLNEAGYYRMILPALELNRTESHCAIVSGIHKWDFNKQFDDYDSPVDFRLIEWSDYVVLPVMFTDVTYIMKGMQEINNDIEFVMDVDINYNELPPYHPQFEKMNLKGQETLIKNLSKVDMLTAPNNLILNYYHDMVQRRSEEFLLCFEHYPNLLSNFTFEEVRNINRNTGEKIKIGMILEAGQGDDVRIIEKVLADLLIAQPDKIELIIFGWSQKTSERDCIFKEIPVVYEKAVTYTSYHSTLNDLGLDIALLPLVDNSFNASGKSLNRFLDFSSLMIPVVSSGIVPFKNIIQNGENGFIANTEEEWTKNITELIGNAQLRKDIGNAAFTTVWAKFSYTPKAMQHLKSVFV